MINSAVREQVNTLSYQITELRSEIQNLTTENIALRLEIQKIGSNLKSDKSSEPKTFVELNSNELSAKTSYAETVVKNSQKTVIVQPKDRTQSVSKTKSDVLNAVDPLNSSLNIGKVKTLKDGGLLVGCENTKTFKQIAKGKFSEQYEIREVRSIRPSIRIVGFSDDIEEDNTVT